MNVIILGGNKVGNVATFQTSLSLMSLIFRQILAEQYPGPIHIKVASKLKVGTRYLCPHLLF